MKCQALRSVQGPGGLYRRGEILHLTQDEAQKLAAEKKVRILMHTGQSSGASGVKFTIGG